MPTLVTKKSKAVVGLDIEAGSVAATEVSADGSGEITQTAIGLVDPGAFHEGEVVDSDALAASLKSLFADHKLSRNVRLGVANQRIAVRSLRMPLLEDATELDTAVRFQAQDELPMPADQAVIDFQVVNRETDENDERKMDVVAVAARRDMIVSMLEALRKAGLKPVGIDLSAFGMIRALAPHEFGDPDPDAATTLYCHLGDITNLAVARGSQCLFSRISPFGIEAIAQRLAERRTVGLDEARRLVLTVGLDGSLETIDGDREAIAGAREALDEGVVRLLDELRLSFDYYGAQEGASAVERVVVCGPGSTIPGLTERLETGLGYGFEVERPEALSHLDQASASRLTISYGLALED